MSKIKGRDTGPELTVRRLLHAMGYRFRLHRKDLPGRPDIVLPRFNKAIFVNGCFWHGHKGCRRATVPKTRKRFWREKIRKNKERDKRCIKELKKAGYSSLTVWECEIKDLSMLSKQIELFIKE